MRSVVVTLLGVLSLAAAPVSVDVPDGAEGGAWLPSLANQPQGSTTVELFEDGTGYVQRDNSDGRYFWKTEDGGVTYLPALGLPPGPMVDFSTSDTGYSASSSTLWRTTDGAGSWGSVGRPEPAVGRVDDISSLHTGPDEGRFVALGLVSEQPSASPCPIDPFSERTQVALSSDGTASWERLELFGSPGRVYELEFHDGFGVAVVSEIDWTQTGSCSFEGRGSAGEFIYTLERTEADGWVAERVLDCRPRVCGSVGLASEHVFSVGFTDGGVAHTTDAGATFVHRQLDATMAETASDVTGEDRIFWVAEIEFANPTVGYAVTNGRGMWRTDDGGASWSPEPSTRDVYDLGIADLAVAGPDQALAGGPTIVVRRTPTP